MGVPKSLDYKDFMNKSTSANPTTWDDMYRFFWKPRRDHCCSC